MKTHLTTTTLALLLTVTSALAGFNNTNMVAWWSFGTPATNGTFANPIVEMDYHVPTASGLFQLVGTNAAMRTEIMMDRTNIGPGWVDHLQESYMYVQLRADNTKRGYVGTKSVSVTGDKSYRLDNYLGGSGGFNAGTVYMVVRPNSTWKSDTRRALFATGHTSAGRLELSIVRNTGILAFLAGRTDSPNQHRTQLNVPNEWSNTQWYFIAATWAPNQIPRIYVREMSPSGPEVSPPAIDSATAGYFTEGSYYTNTVPASGQYGFPAAVDRPFAIGSNGNDTGGGWDTDDGADACIAYFQLDKGYSSVDHIESVFMSLAIPKYTQITIR